MANFCHACAQPVTTAMRACPQCGTALVTLNAPAATATVPTPLGQGTYAPPAATPFTGNSHAGALSAPTARYPKAPLGARFLASLIDTLVSAVAMAPGFLLVAIGETAGETMAELGLLLLLTGGMWAVYYSFAKDGWQTGASIGKRAMGLMVVHLPTDRPCTTGQSALRALILLVLNLVPFVGWLVEPLAVLTVDGGRRVGDHAASTQVIAVSEYANGTV